MRRGPRTERAGCSRIAATGPSSRSTAMSSPSTTTSCTRRSWFGRDRATLPGPASHWGRLAPAAAVALAAASLGMAALEGPVLRAQEGQSVDLRFALRGSVKPDPRIAVVTARESDLQSLGWPVPLRVHARLIDLLRRGGARVIGYDFDFSDASKSPEGRLALLLAARAAGNVVFASYATNSKGQGDALWRRPRLLGLVHATTGDVALPVDADGVIRHLPYEANGLIGEVADDSVCVDREGHIPRRRMHEPQQAGSP